MPARIPLFDVPVGNYSKSSLRGCLYRISNLPNFKFLCIVIIEWYYFLDQNWRPKWASNIKSIKIRKGNTQKVLIKQNIVRKPAEKATSVTTKTTTIIINSNSNQIYITTVTECRTTETTKIQTKKVISKQTYRCSSGSN